MDSKTVSSPFVSREQAAAFLSLSVRSLDRLCREGVGPQARRFGGRVVFDMADLRAWADAHVVHQDQQQVPPPAGVAA